MQFPLSCHISYNVKKVGEKVGQTGCASVLGVMVERHTNKYSIEPICFLLPLFVKDKVKLNDINIHHTNFSICLGKLSDNNMNVCQTMTCLHIQCCHVEVILSNTSRRMATVPDFDVLWYLYWKPKISLNRTLSHKHYTVIVSYDRLHKSQTVTTCIALICRVLLVN